MAQVSQITINNQAFSTFRTTMNDSFSALNSMHSGTSRPASATTGTLWLDTTNAGSNSLTIKFFDGSDDITFATVDTSANTINFTDSALDVVSDTSPQLGGDLASNGNDIIFADNDKAIFGTGSDLKIYHDGSTSIIEDVGTGRLILRSNGDGVDINKGTSENIAKFRSDGVVELYHDNSKKFETTSGGVAVTGDLAVDTNTLFVDSANNRVGIGTNSPGFRLNVSDTANTNIRVTESTNNILLDLRANTTGGLLRTTSNHPFVFGINQIEEMRLTSTGLGVGTSSPSQKFHVYSTGNDIARIETNQTEGRLSLKDATGEAVLKFRNDYRFTNSGGELVRIDSSGRVGINTSSPSSISNLHVADTTANEPMIRIETSDGGNKRLDLFVDNGIGTVSAEQSAQRLAFKTAGGEAVRIDATGNVGILNTTPSNFNASARQLVVGSGSGDNGITIFAGTSNNSSLFLADGTVGTNGYRGSVNYLHNGDALTLHANATETMRLTNGNVGIGNTVMSSFSNLPATDLVVGAGTTNSGITIYSGNTSASSIGFADATTGDGRNEGIIQYHHNGDYMRFFTSATERMRIKSDGVVLIGTSNDLGASNTTDTGIQLATNNIWINNSSASCLRLQRLTSTGLIQTFYYSGSLVGDISVTASATSYNTSSDYRLKENVSYDFDATTRLKQLKPARFNFIADADTTVDGFLAHEVSNIVPEAITGEKDAVDDDGNPEYQGIDQSKLVPLLVKTIQELEARITALETNQP